MPRLLLLLTRTPWQDFRPYDIQAPALTEDGNEVVYMSNAKVEQEERNFAWENLSFSECRLARRTGGINLYRRIKKLEPDVVQLCSLEQLPLGLLLKKAGKCKVVYDCREDMASALYERRKQFPLFVRKLIFSGVRFLESLACKSFDGIITADPGVYELFDKIPDERKMVCYNSALLQQFPKVYLPLKDRKYSVVLLGSLGSHRSGAHDVLDAFEILHAKNLKVNLLFIGEPENEMIDELDRRIKKYQLQDYVHFSGKLPHSEVPAELAQARIGVVPLHDYPKFHRNIACKAFEYMACGMPTIASDLPPQHLFLNEKNALFYPPADTTALAMAIQKLLENIELSTEMGANARESVEREWNGGREQKKLKEFYANIVQLPLREQA